MHHEQNISLNDEFKIECVNSSSIVKEVEKSIEINVPSKPSVPLDN